MQDEREKAKGAVDKAGGTERRRKKRRRAGEAQGEVARLAYGRQQAGKALVGAKGASAAPCLPASDARRLPSCVRQMRRACHLACTCHPVPSDAPRLPAADCKWRGRDCAGRRGGAPGAEPRDGPWARGRRGGGAEAGAAGGARRQARRGHGAGRVLARHRACTRTRLAALTFYAHTPYKAFALDAPCHALEHSAPARTAAGQHGRAQTARRSCRRPPSVIGRPARATAAPPHLPVLHARACRPPLAQLGKPLLPAAQSARAALILRPRPDLNLQARLRLALVGPRPLNRPDATPPPTTRPRRRSASPAPPYRAPVASSSQPPARRWASAATEASRRPPTSPPLSSPRWPHSARLRRRLSLLLDGPAFALCPRTFKSFPRPSRQSHAAIVCAALVRAPRPPPADGSIPLAWLPLRREAG